MVFVDAVRGIRRKEDKKKDRKNRIESLNHSDKKRKPVQSDEFKKYIKFEILHI